MLLLHEDHNRIAHRAYELWETDGCPANKADHYWYRAERELAAEGGFIAQLTRHLRYLLSSKGRDVPLQSEPASPSFAVTFQAYAVIVAALLYFIGWIFLYRYLNRFGIDILSVEVPLYYVFVYSFSVITHILSRHLLLASLAIILLVILGYITSRLRVFTRPLAGLMVVFAFFVGYVGASDAASEASRTLQNYPESIVEFVFRNPEAVSRDPYFQAATVFDPMAAAIPLLQTEHYYFVWIKPMAPAGKLAARLLQIPTSEVLYARIREP
jgi:hypothetical protein